MVLIEKGTFGQAGAAGAAGMSGLANFSAAMNMIQQAHASPQQAFGGAGPVGDMRALGAATAGHAGTLPQGELSVTRMQSCTSSISGAFIAGSCGGKKVGQALHGSGVVA